MSNHQPRERRPGNPSVLPKLRHGPTGECSRRQEPSGSRPACVENFDADEFAFAVEFGGDIGAEFHASFFGSLGDQKVQDVFFLEI